MDAFNGTDEAGIESAKDVSPQWHSTFALNSMPFTAFPDVFLL
jgi:hypothetical protein